MASKKSISTTIRRPLCTYFSHEADQLVKELEWCFNYFPPLPSSIGKSTSQNDGKSIPMLLLPHGAFCDSGPLVAEALTKMDNESGFFSKRRAKEVYKGACAHGEFSPTQQNESRRRTIVIIGTEHESAAQNFISLSGFTHWDTPLGRLPVDGELQRSLSNILPVEYAPFAREHSIENQLPFLQFIAGKQNLEIGIVAISVRGYVRNDELRDCTHGHDNSNILAEMGQTLIEHNNSRAPVAILATTDYNHIGPAYGFVPPGWPSYQAESIPDYIRRNDVPILKAIASNDTDRVYEEGMRSSMCGLGAALVWMKLGILLSNTNHDVDDGVRSQRTVVTPFLLRHCVGSDIGPPNDNQTGFATFFMA